MQILCGTGDGPALLGLLDIKIPGILSVKCNTTEPGRNMREINEQSMEVLYK